MGATSPCVASSHISLADPLRSIKRGERNIRRSARVTPTKAAKATKEKAPLLPPLRTSTRAPRARATRESATRPQLRPLQALRGKRCGQQSGTC